MIRGGRGRGPEAARFDRTDLDRSTADRTDRYDDLVEPQVVGAQKGPDGITNWMLVWAGLNMISALLPLFSAMWQNNLLPTGLGDATLRYIPKGTKPAQEISGYRPISLTSCIGKLYTMIWLPKLTSKLSPWIGRQQGAFQKGTGALEHGLQTLRCFKVLQMHV